MTVILWICAALAASAIVSIAAGSMMVMTDIKQDEQEVA